MRAIENGQFWPGAELLSGHFALRKLICNGRTNKWKQFSIVAKEIPRACTDISNGNMPFKVPGMTVHYIHYLLELFYIRFVAAWWVCIPSNAIGRTFIDRAEGKIDIGSQSTKSDIRQSYKHWQDHSLLFHHLKNKNSRAFTDFTETTMYQSVIKKFSVQTKLRNCTEHNFLPMPSNVLEWNVWSGWEFSDAFNDIEKETRGGWICELSRAQSPFIDLQQRNLTAIVLSDKRGAPLKYLCSSFEWKATMIEVLFFPGRLPSKRDT